MTQAEVMNVLLETTANLFKQFRNDLSAAIQIVVVAIVVVVFDKVHTTANFTGKVDRGSIDTICQVL